MKMWTLMYTLLLSEMLYHLQWISSESRPAFNRSELKSYDIAIYNRKSVNNSEINKLNLTRKEAPGEKEKSGSLD